MPVNPRLIENGTVVVKQCRHGLFAYNRNDMYIGRSLDQYGEWTEPELQLLFQILRAGDVVLDVGANLGTHTVAFAKHVGNSGFVIAFEPQRLTYQLLCANVALNALTNVRCHLAVASDEAGTALIPTLDPAIAQNFGALAAEGHQKGERVPAMRVDDLQLGRCSLIKIDVEGAEQRVLAGARKTIAGSRPVLFVENNADERSPALLRLLDELGYSCWWHVADYFSPDNYFGHRERLFGVYYETNVLCFPKEARVNATGLVPVAGLDDTPSGVLRRKGILTG